jgi:NAD(P)-dependent dehydrogenase (short-subunit alcohol dehydrogenase family)
MDRHHKFTKWNWEMENTLSEKTYVVTGATSGIGLAAAEILVTRGASVIGIGRSPERCAEAEKRLRAINPQAEVNYHVADLSSQSQIRHVAEAIRQDLAARRNTCLDGLLNNAGTFTYWMALTPEGFETQWAVNYLAAFLLTHELLPLLQSASNARVVTVSSDSHYGIRLNWDDIQLRRHYNGLRAYGQTKLAGVLFSLELNRRLGPQSRLRAFAADPGLVKTEIGFKGTPGLARWVWGIRRSGGVSAAQSAAGIVYLLTEPSIQDSDQIYWKDGQPKPASRAALDANSAQCLWALSEKMCAIAA